MTPKSALVTGISGFTGPYVRAALEASGYRVFGLGRGETARPDVAKVDLLDESALNAYLASIKVDAIVHLAGQSFVAHDNLGDLYRANLIGTVNLLEAAGRSQSKLQKIVLASSASVYGRPAKIPVDESAPAVPISHYGVSKYAMEQMASLWFDRLPILIVRPFTYVGVGQSPRFVVAKLVDHLCRGAPEVQLGDTSVVREFMDVRDVAPVYVRLVESETTGQIINVASGKGYSLQTVVDEARNLSGRPMNIVRSDLLRRTQDVPALVGSPELLERLVGELRFRPLQETLKWMLQKGRS